LIIDSSAIIAIVFKESNWQEVFNKMTSAKTRGIGTPSLVESGIIITARLRKSGKNVLMRLIHEFDITIVPFGQSHWQTAIEAYKKFGKGRHKASLNFGDCLTYATAYLAKQPLLYVGNDFSHTDLESA
jgi:ribonuclease VapC